MQNFVASKIREVIEYTSEDTEWKSLPRPHHILAYQISGFYFHHFKGHSLLVKPDTFYFINQKDNFRVERTICGGSALVIHFFTDGDIDSPSFGVNSFDNPDIKKNFLKIFNAWRQDKEQNHFLCYSLFYKLLDSLKFCTEKTYIRHEKQNQLEQIVIELETNYQNKINYELLAKKIGLSLRYLNKIFKLSYGVTPHQYLINYRILKAMDLLSSTPLKIEEIALQTGFNDAYYFSKFFKGQTGMPPSAFRKHL
jgi:AraC-like DNA-binding protein